MEIKGYIVFAADGAVLSEKETWQHHPCLADCFVHPASWLVGIEERAKDWQRKPAFAIPATYSTERGLVILACEAIKVWNGSAQ